MKKALWISLASVFGALTVVGAVGNTILKGYRPQLNAALGISSDTATLDENAVYFSSEFDSVEEQVAVEGELCVELEAEGAVLLKNSNNTLPFKSTDTFSLFSTSSVDPIYGGTGSGKVSANDAVNFRKAMNTEFGSNSTNVSLYKRYLQDLSNYRRVNAETTGGTIDQYKINEAPWSEVMTSDIEATMPNFPNAIVVLARSGGEGNDLPITECSDGTNGNYLVLNQNEKDMLAGLKALKDAGKISTITVLLNGSNALQLDFLDSEEYGIDAAAWIGGVGTNGMTAVAELLSGKRNFSGRLSDTFLKDNLSAPSIANFGLQAYTNSSAGTGEYSTSWVQYNKAGDTDKCNENYIVYQEGIYIGYRYYETRYADVVMGTGNTTGYDYSADVAFPFGYGDSYTEWSYSDFSITEHDETIEATVTVTNSGSVSGKHAVEIYCAPTYTDYDKQYGIEKSAIVLGGFTKTGELASGASETVTVEVKKRDLASYDVNGKATYILDGDYRFTVAHNAHEANNNVLTALGYGTSCDEAGDADLVKTWQVDGVDDVTCSTSEETGYKITNAFAHADLNRYEGTTDQTITYLTRSNWNGTMPTTNVKLAINETMWADGLDYSTETRKARVEKMKEKYYSEYL
ncbi:MAG: glycoside hydrolase family 3 C-terminal domain-containing protein, partial [Bacilli bacterium]|nr:glycoside hydrolase family 3 C-terminal domain-containing protein [Bacilli bacterium]